MRNDETLVLIDLKQELAALLAVADDDPPARDDQTLVDDALELVADLWPRPSGATVVLETHQWMKLRRLLLALPKLWMEANRV